MYLQAATIYGSLIPGSEYIRSLVRQGTISRDAAKRLRWMDHYAHSQNARQTCRYFGISAQTFYRWKNRFDPYDLTTLEEESRRPRHVRQSESPVKVVERVRELREEHPRWGRDKLAVLLKREGIEISGSAVGREMKKLKARGLLVEPENVRQAKLARKRRRTRYATRRLKVPFSTEGVLTCPPQRDPAPVIRFCWIEGGGHGQESSWEEIRPAQGMLSLDIS